tara:strand:+ start:886 stop:1113 length:228 start_codon:yes stop_codon:yes gene_type:complete
MLKYINNLSDKMMLLTKSKEEKKSMGSNNKWFRKVINSGENPFKLCDNKCISLIANEQKKTTTAGFEPARENTTP